MNYYPTNFYSSYPYQGGYQQQLPQTQVQQQMVPVAAQNIPGKIVESFDIAKVTDVPFGGYGVFPKADFSEVYVKMWNGNGTTNLVTFKPVIEASIVKEATEGEQQISQEHISAILEKICQLEEKIDNMAVTATATQKRKELSASAY